MKSIMRRTAVLVAALTLPAFLVAGNNSNPSPRPASTVAATVIHEEDARWNCRTMGNHRCADPVATWVGPTELTGAVRACGSPLRGRPAVPPSLMRACLSLGVLKAQTVKDPDGSSYTLAAGPARVHECRTQYAGTELKACLNQPRYV